MAVGRPDYWYGQILVFEQTPTPGRTDAGPTSDWAVTHAVNPSIHHTRYSNAEALAAMGAKADSNPYCHDRTSPGVTDHGLLTGLADDDHAQYLLIDGSRHMSLALRSDASSDLIYVYKAGVHRYTFTCSPDAGACLGIYNPVTSAWVWRVDESGNINIVGTVDGIDLSAGLFFDRGNFSNYDKTLGNFTLDGTYRDWDLSAIVPAGAKGVLLRVLAKSAAAGLSFRVRKNGTASTTNFASYWSKAGSVYDGGELTVSCDANRVIEYAGDAGAWVELNVMVSGWWF